MYVYEKVSLKHWGLQAHKQGITVLILARRKEKVNAKL